MVQNCGLKTGWVFSIGSAIAIAQATGAALAGGPCAARHACISNRAQRTISTGDMVEGRQAGRTRDLREAVGPSGNPPRPQRAGAGAAASSAWIGRNLAAGRLGLAELDARIVGDPPCLSRILVCAQLTQIRDAWGAGRCLIDLHSMPPLRPVEGEAHDAGRSLLGDRVRGSVPS